MRNSSPRLWQPDSRGRRRRLCWTLSRMSSVVVISRCNNIDSLSVFCGGGRRGDIFSPSISTYTHAHKVDTILGYISIYKYVEDKRERREMWNCRPLLGRFCRVNADRSVQQSAANRANPFIGFIRYSCCPSISSSFLISTLYMRV